MLTGTPISSPPAEDAEAWVSRLTEHLRLAWATDPAHDFHHLLRVLRTARKIAAAEGNHDPLVLAVAVMLHDLVSLPKDAPDRAQASRRSAEAAIALLQRLGFPEERLPAVAHAIEAHSYSASIPARSPEARALQDADRIDALGAIGIARCFAVSGSIGRPLLDASDPLALHRPLDDAAFGLDHFGIKLLVIPDMLLTPTGRRIAAARVEYMRGFLQQIEGECLL